MKIQHQLLLDTAQKMGIQVTDISAILKVDAALLEAAGKKELLIRGTPTSLINARSQYYCDNKQLTKLAYLALNIPSPKSMIFQKLEEVTAVAFFQEETNYVCKPIDGTNGVGVAMNIRSLQAVKNYWEAHKELASTFMLEEQIEGKDLRVQVVDGQIIAACTRVPAFITGDGEQTVRQLAQRLRERVRANNPANDLILDETTKQLLAAKGFNLSSIPPKDQIISLKKVANMAQGAIAVDLTAELHPAFQTWINQLTTYLGTSYFGIDIIATDHQVGPSAGAWVLEINARPEWLHHTFSENRQHDMAKIVLEALFFDSL